MNYAYNNQYKTPTALLEHYVNLTGWAEGVQLAGGKVFVFQRFLQNETLERNGVQYRFCADSFGPIVRSWQQPWSMHWQIKKLVQQLLANQEQVAVQVNGLLFPLHIRTLRWLLPAECPVVVQHHAERPWKWPLRVLQRYGLRVVDRFFFTTHALAEPWLVQNLIGSLQQVDEIVETSSSFQFQSRSTARSITKMQGVPVVFWAGRLTAVKDPLTILTGFEITLRRLPDMRLYMAYLDGDLLPEIQAKLTANPNLQQAVSLLGSIPHQEIATYYNSADIFVQGSEREGSGIALLDALACGVVPVVTNIPSFQVITNGGTIGQLWPVGDAAAFAEALLSVIDNDIEAQSLAARQFFEAKLSFEQLGRQALAAFDLAVKKRLQNNDQH